MVVSFKLDLIVFTSDITIELQLWDNYIFILTFKILFHLSFVMLFHECSLQPEALDQALKIMLFCNQW
jgi:hypothetical protein